MAALKPRVRADLAVVEIQGEAVVFDPVASQLHHLNPTATILFKLCDGTGTARELADDIADVFGLAHAEVLQHVRQVVKQFKEAGILDGKRRGATETTDG